MFVSVGVYQFLLRVSFVSSSAVLANILTTFKSYTMTKHYTKAFSPQEKQAAIAKYADLIKYSARYSGEHEEARYQSDLANSMSLDEQTTNTSTGSSSGMPDSGFQPYSYAIHLPLLFQFLLIQ
jgi:hypothetical protein